MFSGREKTFAFAVLLFAASAVSATPTSISAIHPFTISSLSDRDAGNVSCDLGSGAVCDRMSDLAKAFLQPPLPDGRSMAADNRYLPAVPPAMVMVLTGFMCVSLVRDRKTWVAVLAGILWVGQTGIWALPELTSRLSRRIHTSRLIEPELEAPYTLEDGFYPESFPNETKYTGLLHHLEGIPQGSSAFSRIRKIVIPSEAEESVLIRGFRSADNHTRVFQHAIVEAHLALNKSFNCLVSGTKQFVYFTPAFIFNLIPRGPPISQIGLFL